MAVEQFAQSRTIFVEAPAQVDDEGGRLLKGERQVIVSTVPEIKLRIPSRTATLPVLDTGIPIIWFGTVPLLSMRPMFVTVPPPAPTEIALSP
jgi:hypothetical protein